MQPLPLIIEPAQLEKLLGSDDNDEIIVIDLSKAENYSQGHIPGAIFVDYRNVINGLMPVPGRIPEISQLQELARSIGLTEYSHVVAYDDEGGGKASRFLWTLHVLGHQRCSLLNGVIFSWANEGHPLSRDVPKVAASDFKATLHDGPVANKADILARLHDPKLKLIDARSAEEYNGSKSRTAKAGHIPGAVNLNWMDTMDRDHHYRFLPDTVLQEMLDRRGVSKDNDVIVYCMTHHRSAHCYVMLRHLGYPSVKGYPGSFLEWGNSPDTPVQG